MVMADKKTGKLLLLLLILLLASAGVSASFFLTKFTGKEPQPQLEPTTRFYVTNESEIFFGKPAFYRMILENQEGEGVNYQLKVRLAGEEIHNEEIMLNSSEILNQTISFIPNFGGDYLKLEFLLYKDNESYRTRVFQVAPAIDYSIVSSLAVAPPLLQNSDMEKDSAWKFSGREFTGNYTASEWSSGRRAYQIKAAKGVKKNSFGSIIQNFSSENNGFASLSLDVKSNNASYYIQAVMNDKVLWENYTGTDWQRIKLPVLLKKSSRLELKVIAKNDTRSGITTWLDNIVFANYSSVKIEKISKVAKQAEPYTKQKSGDIIVYKFNTGEKLELKVSKGNVSKDNAVYTTANKDNNIIFMGERYEKILPVTASVLLLIIMDVKDKKLKINESIKLQNGYAVTLKQIQNRSLHFSISKDNRTVREITSAGNSSIEYWKYINEFKKDDYKKQKVIKIIPGNITRSEVVLDIIQYGNKKIVSAGNKYGEFQVTGVTSDSIIMKNIQPLKIEAGKEISLMSGKIKIKV